MFRQLFCPLYVIVTKVPIIYYGMPQAVKEHYIHVQVNVYQFKLELNNESMPHRALRGLSTKFHIETAQVCTAFLCFYFRFLNFFSKPNACGLAKKQTKCLWIGPLCDPKAIN